MDKNFLSFADTQDVSLSRKTLPIGFNALEFNDILKISNVKRGAFTNLFIFGGKEDCIDIMRFSQDIRIENCTLHPNGLFASTIKGGCDHITFRNVIIQRHGKKTDIDIGNFTEVTSKKTRNVVLDHVSMDDGSPVRVRVLNGEKPKLIGTNAKIKDYSFFWPIINFGFKIYKLFKKD